MIRGIILIRYELKMAKSRILKNCTFVILIKIMVVMYMQKKLYLNLKNFLKLIITKINV